MGLSLENFLDLTPFEFMEVHRRWNQKIEKERENELWQKMYTARLQLFRQLCPPQGKKIRITDLWEMEGDAEVMKAHRNKNRSTRQRFEALINKYRK